MDKKTYKKLIQKEKKQNKKTIIIIAIIIITILSISTIFIKKQFKNNKIGNNSSSQEIIEPNNIAGIKISQEKDKLTLENSNLSLTNIIENYKYITDSCIDLSSFIKEYKNNAEKKQEEDSDNIKLEIATANTNPYIKYRKLEIDKKTGKPIKMECKSENKKETVYILYNEVKLNTK